MVSGEPRGLSGPSVCLTGPPPTCPAVLPDGAGALAGKGSIPLLICGALRPAATAGVTAAAPRRRRPSETWPPSGRDGTGRVGRPRLSVSGAGDHRGQAFTRHRLRPPPNPSSDPVSALCQRSARKNRSRARARPWAAAATGRRRPLIATTERTAVLVTTCRTEHQTMWRWLGSEDTGR